MKSLSNFLGLMLVMVVLVGCASREITGGESYARQEFIKRPDRIIVYDFAATAKDLAASSAITGRYVRREAPQKAKDIQLGRELGSRIAKELVMDIRGMGLVAVRYGPGAPPQIGDIVITGEFVSIDKGSRGKRMLIGFGAGANELRTIVEVYQITPSGPRLLKYREIRAGGGKSPGMAVPLIVAGVVTGSLITSTIISGSLNIAKELGPEGIRAAADRTAKEIAKELRRIWRQRGWI